MRSAASLRNLICRKCDEGKTTCHAFFARLVVEEALEFLKSLQPISKET